MTKPEEIIDKLIKSFKGKTGIFCLNCLLMRSSFSELRNFMENNYIGIDKSVKTKTGYLRNLAVFYYNAYKNLTNLQNKFGDPLDLMGNMLLNDEKINEHLSEFDYISKQELIDVFANFCADFGISVFSTAAISDYSLDLYLIKKSPRLRTEAVFIRTRSELRNEDGYKKLLSLIANSSKIAMWVVFVTTPAGVYDIGLERLIKDMENLNVWLYVVDPIHKKILGVTKGKKSKSYDQNLSESFIQKIPHTPLRAPSQVLKISKYKFSESDSYKPKNFHMFDLLTEEEYDKIIQIPREKYRYQKIFRNFFIIDKSSGISILSYSSENETTDELLISGFLTAMDQFVSELGGASALEEIDYKGFFVQAAYGDLVKLALFLSEPADQILKERLSYFIKQFEEKYKPQIEYFQSTGNVSIFNNKEIISLAKEILEI